MNVFRQLSIGHKIIGVLFVIVLVSMLILSGNSYSTKRPKFKEDLSEEQAYERYNGDEKPPKAPAPQPKAPAPQPKAPAPQPKAPAPQPKAPAPQPKAPAPQPKAPEPESKATETEEGYNVELPKELKYYGQCNQDKNIFEKVMKKEPSFGRFIEFGAADGLTHTNSKFFEETLKWKGICIEPNPHEFEILKKNRPDCIKVNKGIGVEKGTLTFVIAKVTQLSGFLEFMSESHHNRILEKGIVDVKFIEVDTLENILRENDFYFDRYELLSLDCEGCELQFLKNIKTDIIFETLVIEMNPYEKTNAETRETLAYNGYNFVMENCRFDFMYQHQTSKTLLPQPDPSDGE